IVMTLRDVLSVGTICRETHRSSNIVNVIATRSTYAIALRLIATTAQPTAHRSRPGIARSLPVDHFTSVQTTLRTGGRGRIRTSVARKERQIYSLLVLATHPPVLGIFLLE